MRQEARGRSTRIHALRLDRSAIAQGGIAATITLVVAWIIAAW